MRIFKTNIQVKLLDLIMLCLLSASLVACGSRSIEGKTLTISVNSGESVMITSTTMDEGLTLTISFE